MLRPAFALLVASVLGTAADPLPLPEQPAPFSVWLDFPALARPGSADPALPIWFEGLQTLRAPATGSEPPKTFYRLRLRRLPTLQRELLVRVFFDDLPDMQPSVSAWSESGKERFRSEPMGSGVGLPTSESVVVPLEGADYLDIEVPGNGSNLRGTLASSLKDVSVRQSIDFQSAPDVISPFGSAPSRLATDDDSKLFGRVQATLEPQTIRLVPGEAASVEFEVELGARPLATVLNFEVLNADLESPPTVIVNDFPAQFASVLWPDLADPAFRGEARGDEPHLRFQYTGWLAAQVAIPPSALRVGLNKVTVSLSEGSGAVAIRKVELQLKQNWKHLDYILTPANR